MNLKSPFIPLNEYGSRNHSLTLDMTSKATVAGVGTCCDYATCFTNLTHFPKQDAQVVFIYLATTLIALSKGALPWFSQHNLCQR